MEQTLKLETSRKISENAQSHLLNAARILLDKMKTPANLAMALSECRKCVSKFERNTRVEDLNSYYSYLSIFSDNILDKWLKNQKNPKIPVAEGLYHFWDLDGCDTANKMLLRIMQSLAYDAFEDDYVFTIDYYDNLMAFINSMYEIFKEFYKMEQIL